MRGSVWLVGLVVVGLVAQVYAKALISEIDLEMPTYQFSRPDSIPNPVTPTMREPTTIVAWLSRSWGRCPTRWSA